MRTIKFRAWDKINKKWLDIEFIYLNTKGEVVTIIDNNENHYGLKEIELMQFIGLLDKNGKEIFEGDIINLTINNIKREVIWDYSELERIERHELYVEVVGNIYETPELLVHKNI